MKPIPNGRVIDTVIPEGQPFVLRIFEAGVSDKPIGSLLAVLYKDYTEVLHVYVEKPYRGKGYAQDLVREIQKMYSYIVTGWSGSETAGKELFLKMGFEVKKALFKNKQSTLEWVRDEKTTK